MNLRQKYFRLIRNLLCDYRVDEKESSASDIEEGIEELSLPFRKRTEEKLRRPRQDTGGNGVQS